MEGLREILELAWQALVTSVLAGALLAYVGVFVILRRTVFVGIALSQLAALGCSVAFLAEGAAWTGIGALAVLRDHWVMAATMEFLGILILTRPERGRLSRETRLGLCWAAAGALAVLMVSKSAHGTDELRTLLTGEILFVTDAEFAFVLATCVPVGLLLLLWFRRFLLLAFDREMAWSLGLRVPRWELCFFLLLGTLLAVLIHKCGVLFTVGFLILPGAAALCVLRSPAALVLGAGALGGSAALLGFLASQLLDLPTGPSQVAVAFVLFVLAWVAGRVRRG